MKSENIGDRDTPRATHDRYMSIILITENTSTTAKTITTAKTGGAAIHSLSIISSSTMEDPAVDEKDTAPRWD